MQSEVQPIYHAGFRGLKERGEGITRAAVIFVANKAAIFTEKKLLPRIDLTIIKHTEVNFPEGFEERFKYFLENNYRFICNSNHTTQLDGKTIVAFLHRIFSMSEKLLPTKGIRGAQMLYAKSLEETQGEFIKRISSPVLQQLETDGLHPLPFVRPEEIEKYRDEGRLDKVSESKKLNTSSLRKLLKGVIQNHDVVVTFAEATVKGGRRKGKFTREIYGLQKAKPNTLFSMSENLAKMNDNKVAFIDMGMFGGHYYFSANHKLPTIGGIRAVMGLGRSDFVKINVGMPIDVAEIIRELGENFTEEAFNDAGMRRIVPLIPREAHGLYLVEKKAA